MERYLGRDRIRDPVSLKRTPGAFLMGIASQCTGRSASQQFKAGKPSSPTDVTSHLNRPGDLVHSMPRRNTGQPDWGPGAK